MSDIMKFRCDQLAELGLHFNGQEYIGSEDLSDVNVHYTDIICYSNDVWDKLIDQIKLRIK